MRKCHIKYFSALNPRQKDKSVWAVTKFAHGLESLSDGLAKTMVYEGSLRRADLSGCKMFYQDSTKTWFPLNIKEVIQITKGYTI